MNTQTKTFIINITVAAVFFGFFMLFMQIAANLESRFGAFCTPALIAAGMSALCMAFGAFCLIRAAR